MCVESVESVEGVDFICRLNYTILVEELLPVYQISRISEV